MHPRTERSHLVATTALAAAAILVLGGCAAASSGPSASPSPSPATAASPSPASTGATPSPAAPAPSPLPGFTTPVPPPATTAWTGIRWRALVDGDPLAGVRSVVRWKGGFIAVGIPIVSGASSRTPAWVSPDGATWTALAPGVLGASTVILDVVPTAGGVAALTLTGGASTCGPGDIRTLGLDCLALTPPLQVVASSDGQTWTTHPGPDLPMPAVYGGDAGLDRPRMVAGQPGLVAWTWDRPAAVVEVRRPATIVAARAVPVAPPVAPGLLATQAQGPCRLARSGDGVAWETLPLDAFPAGFVCSDIAPVAGGFVAVGLQGEDRAGALWSGDGRTWTPVTMPASGPGYARSLAVGSNGLVGLGDTNATPGQALWWSTTTGRAWKPLPGYPPLGVWEGQGEGTGLVPDGELVADGERFVGYRGGTRPAAWTSFDGLTWQPLAISPVTPPDQSWRLLALPIGLLWIGDAGSAWLGEATAP